MHAILESLVAQHRDLNRLIVLLDKQPSLEPDPAAPHVGVLVDLLVYLTNFPDVSHHPLEDHIAERLLARSALPVEMVRELEEQHGRLAIQGRDLLRDMEGAMRRETVSLELVALNARLYAERLRHNIAFEELVLFPAAARSLQSADWEEIEAAHALAPDPLFSGHVDQRFVELHRLIALEAACGCEHEERGAT